MAESLLLEIGMEEVPARFMRASAEQLKQKLEKWLSDSRIAFEASSLYATPRRIAVLITGVADKQADISGEVKGPSRHIALDEQKNWTKAAQGFARSQGVQEDALFVREVAGVEYVFARKSGAGEETTRLLPQGLSDIIQSMTFPKNMRWGANDLKFVRPIRWLVAMYGKEIVPLEIAGVVSGRTSQGHRFLGQPAEIASPDLYVDRLREQHVIADIDTRKSMIVEQIGRLAASRQWSIAIKDDLLEEVLFLVEYPTVLFGAFDPAFLNIPQEVLITSMREHQRYFPVFDEAGQLLPYFVTVRNGDDRSLEQVARGNEKVLRARLSDAKFFYEEDQKLKIDAALARLETIVFHEELGTIGDKVRRIVNLTDRLGELARLSGDDRKSVARAAQICKFDLVSQMVYEFPELQGIMGEDYARKLGEPDAVAKAINEHYQPRYSGDRVPSSITGALVSIADKLDTIAGCFSIGIVPTGSQDPYALRRQAAGIVNIMLEFDFSLTLDQLFEEALKTHEGQKPLKRPIMDITKELNDFFALRLKHVLSEVSRYDITEAVMEGGIAHIPSVVRKAAAIAEFIARSDAKSVADAFGRVCNLAAKAENDTIDIHLFVDDAEHDLYKKWESLHIVYNRMLQEGKEASALAELTQLKDAVNNYFEKVMVMSDIPAQRAVRLALLSAIASDIKKFADFSRIVW